jgi:hypothetical protein
MGSMSRQATDVTDFMLCIALLDHTDVRVTAVTVLDQGRGGLMKAE